MLPVECLVALVKQRERQWQTLNKMETPRTLEDES